MQCHQLYKSFLFQIARVLFRCASVIFARFKVFSYLGNSGR
ncbi:hypothetical protein HMPREF9554_00238 [Treponema phagedenis F0421]|nr:hypothetical protein HMPREF9554_00238 [Treponema phagedenis F0421]